MGAVCRVRGGSSTADVLVEAAERGDVFEVCTLLQQGVSVNWLGRHGQTPLYAAVALNRADVVRVLLRSGADTRLRTSDDGDTPLVRAAMMGNADICLQLLLHGAHPQDANADGLTPLVIASRRGHLNVVRFLLAHGADPSRGVGMRVRTSDFSGMTPLLAAVSEGHVDVVELLLSAGAKKDPHALASALAQNNARMMRALVAQ